MPQIYCLVTAAALLCDAIVWSTAQRRRRSCASNARWRALHALVVALGACERRRIAAKLRFGGFQAALARIRALPAA